MNGCLLVVSLMTLLIAQRATVVQAATAGSRIAPCTADPNERGYPSITDINADMRDELDRIERGGITPTDTYVFPLCSRQVYDASNEPLIPLLSGSIIQCGTAGTADASCVFRGGTTQVVLEDSAVPGYDVASVTLVGVTHEQFTESAVSGRASDTTLLTLWNPVFRDFESLFAVSQTAAARGVQPFRVGVIGGQVLGPYVNAVSIFSNNDGELRIAGLLVNDVNATALVSTGSHRATTMIESTEVRAGSIKTVFFSSNGATTKADRVNVHDMFDMVRVFSVQGSGSAIAVKDSEMSNNIITRGLWTAVEALDGGLATISNTSLVGNQNTKDVFSAQNSASMQLDRVHVVDNIGGLVLEPSQVSSIIVANQNSHVDFQRMRVRNHTEFTVAALASFRSMLTSRQNCFYSGNAEAAIYISDDSTQSSSHNYVGAGFVSKVCTEPDMRLVQEDVGSGCFDPTRETCTWTCTPFGTEEVCRAQEPVNKISVETRRGLQKRKFLPATTSSWR